MSCGTKIEGKYGFFSEKQDLSDALERRGEYTLANQVRHGECLDSYDLRRAEDALREQGLSRDFDYHERTCRCSSDREEPEPTFDIYYPGEDA